MEKELAKRIVEACEDCDVEARIYENYLGRNMYSRLTTGVVVKNNKVSLLSVLIKCADMFVEVIDNEVEPVYNIFYDICTDSMGNSVIYY